jgi:FtsH-binding integral membrane protein
MGRIVDAWSGFSDSLNTRGGTIALLFVSNVGLAFGVVHIMHHGDTSQAASVIVSTFASFNGALLIALTSKDKINGAGNVTGNGTAPTNGNGNGTPTPSVPPDTAASH